MTNRYYPFEFSGTFGDTSTWWDIEPDIKAREIDKEGNIIELSPEIIDDLPAEFIDNLIIGYESVSEEEDRSVGKAWRRSAIS